MRFTIEPLDGHLHATLYGRDTAEEMHDFLVAVHAAAQQHDLAKILISVRRSRAVFKPEDYGLAANMRGYVNGMVTPACQIALVGDTQEVIAANEYIEMVAREQGVNVRAFGDERTALRWLKGPAAPNRRYRFTRIVIAGAPEDAGVYALWDEEELIYYGRAEGGVSIRSRLLDHYYQGVLRPTHYGWELCKDPALRELELLREHERRFGHPPRHNKAA